MKTKLQIGDRVKVYGYVRSFTNGSYSNLEGEKGTYQHDVTTPNGNIIRIHLDDGLELNCDIKQCRKLIKTPKQKLYVLVPNNPIENNTSLIGYYNKDAAEEADLLNFHKIKEFVEVKKK